MIGKRLLRSYLIIHRKTKLKPQSQLYQAILPNPSMDFENYPTEILRQV